MAAKKLVEQLRKYGMWGQHPKFPVEDWQEEVSEGNTRLGYWAWVEASLEFEAIDYPQGQDSPEGSTVTCCLCGEPTPAKTAHIHQTDPSGPTGWVGDECCWDERLRGSE